MFEKTLEEGLLAEIANLSATKFEAKFELQIKKLVNVEKKLARLNKALLEEGLFFLIWRMIECVSCCFSLSFQ